MKPNISIISVSISLIHLLKEKYFLKVTKLDPILCFIVTIYLQPRPRKTTKKMVYTSDKHTQKQKVVDTIFSLEEKALENKNKSLQTSKHYKPQGKYEQLILMASVTTFTKQKLVKMQRENKAH